MDRYTAKGEFAYYEQPVILGPCLVPCDTTKVIEFNCNGTTTIHEHGSTTVGRTHRITDDAYKLTRDEWANTVARAFYNGFYHTYQETFEDEIVIMRSDKCKGTLSSEWSVWLAWAGNIIRQSARDRRQ